MSGSRCTGEAPSPPTTGAALRVTADRVLVPLHTKVAALEGATSPSRPRGGAATAADATALAPLADRLRGASGD